MADSTPWSYTWDEFDEGIRGPTDHVDGFDAAGDVVCFRAIDPDTTHQRLYWAHFDWALLQYVEPAPDSYAWTP